MQPMGKLPVILSLEYAAKLLPLITLIWLLKLMEIQASLSQPMPSPKQYPQGAN